VSEPDEIVVIGRQLAAAQAADQRHTRPGPSPIAGIDYPPGAAEQWRWVDCSEDNDMSAFVRSYVDADEMARRSMRDCLGLDDLYTVLLFARRKAFAAIRTGDPAAASEAFDALSAVTPDRVDWRDLSWGAWLSALAAVRAGVAPATAAAAAIARADPDAAEILSDVVTSDDCTDEEQISRACGVLVVDTAGGRVLLDAGDDADVSSRDLATIAVNLAEAIQAEGTYRAHAPEIGGDIADVWIRDRDDERVAAAMTELTGCVSVRGDPVPGPGVSEYDHFLLVFLAEAASDDDAARLRDGAHGGGRPGSVVIAVATARLCAILVAACSVASQPSFEDFDSMARFAPIVRALMGSRPA
jgi:hypothetical protein